MLAWIQRSKVSVMGWLRQRRVGAKTDSPEHAQTSGVDLKDENSASQILSSGFSIDEHQRSPTLPPTDESDEQSKIKETAESQKLGTAIFYDDSPDQSGSKKQDSKDNLEEGGGSSEHTHQESVPVIESNSLVDKDATNETVSHNGEINEETSNASICIPGDVTATVDTRLDNDSDDAKNYAKDVVVGVNDVLENPNEITTEAVGDIGNVIVNNGENSSEMETVLAETRTKEVWDGVDKVEHQQVKDSEEVVGEVNNVVDVTQTAKFVDEFIDVVDPMKTGIEEIVVESVNVLDQATTEEHDQGVDNVVHQQINATTEDVYAESGAFDEIKVTEFDNEQDNGNLVQTTINNNADMGVAMNVADETAPSEFGYGFNNVVLQQINATENVVALGMDKSPEETKVTEFGDEQAEDNIMETIIHAAVNEGVASNVVEGRAPTEFGEGVDNVVEQQDNATEDVAAVNNASEETKVTEFGDEQKNSNIVELETINDTVDVVVARNVVQETAPTEVGEDVENIVLQQNNATEDVGDVNNASEEIKIPESADEHRRDNVDVDPTILAAEVGAGLAVNVLEETAPSENCEGVDNIVQQQNNAIDDAVAKNNSFEEIKMEEYSHEQNKDNIADPTNFATEIGVNVDVEGNILEEKHPAKFGDGFDNVPERTNASEEAVGEVDNLAEETNMSELEKVNAALPTNIVTEDGFDVDASTEFTDFELSNANAVINTNDAAADSLNLTEDLQNTKQVDELISFASETNIQLDDDDISDSGVTLKNVPIDIVADVSTEASNISGTNVSDGKADTTLDAWSSNTDPAVPDAQTVSESSNHSPNVGERQSCEPVVPCDDPFDRQENDSGTKQLGATDVPSETCHNSEEIKITEKQISGKPDKTFIPSEDVSLFSTPQEFDSLENVSELATPVYIPEDYTDVIGKDEAETVAGREVIDFKPDLDENMPCALEASDYVANGETEAINDLSILGKPTAAEDMNSNQNGLQDEMENLIEISSTQPEIDADTSITNAAATVDAAKLMQTDSVTIKDVLDYEHIDKSSKVQHGTHLFEPGETASKFSDVGKSEVDFQEADEDVQQLTGGLKEGNMEDNLKDCSDSAVSLQGHLNE